MLKDGSTQPVLLRRGSLWRPLPCHRHHAGWGCLHPHDYYQFEYESVLLHIMYRLRTTNTIHAVSSAAGQSDEILDVFNLYMSIQKVLLSYCMDALLQLLLTKEGVTSHNNKQNIFIIFCRFCCLHSVHDFFVWQEMKSIMLKGKILTLAQSLIQSYTFASKQMYELQTTINYLLSKIKSFLSISNACKRLL